MDFDNNNIVIGSTQQVGEQRVSGDEQLVNELSKGLMAAVAELIVNIKVAATTATVLPPNAGMCACLAGIALLIAVQIYAPRCAPFDMLEPKRKRQNIRMYVHRAPSQGRGAGWEWWGLRGSGGDVAAMLG